MIKIVLGKRQCLSHEACEALPEGIVPTLHMIRLATVFADRLMLAGRKDLLVGVPEIAKSATASVGFGEPLPSLAATGLTAVAHEERYNLPNPPAQSNPDPAWVILGGHKRPPFIEF